MTEELLSRSVAIFTRKANPDLPWNEGSDAHSVMRVAEELNWLTRDRV
jgi:hypothetical protein